MPYLAASHTPARGPSRKVPGSGGNPLGSDNGLGGVGTGGLRGARGSMKEGGLRAAASTGESPETMQEDHPGRRVRDSMISRFTEPNIVPEKKYHWTYMFVIREDGNIGNVWSSISTSLILYIATVFPYKLCFLDFSPTKPEDEPEPIGWEIIETTLSWLFIVDLVVNFFVSYTDREGNEVFDLRRIAVKYVCTVMFWVNFMACIPEIAATAIMGFLMGTSGDGSSGSANKALLILRLQRITRLARMLRLAKLAKLMQLSFVRKMSKLRGPRMMGLAVALFWSMHLLGCGWFLIAALHADPTETWVYSRGIEASPPEDQWLTSMYWVLTVFTTVGFGDISPSTIPEIIYGDIVMILGTVLNTVFLSEIINLLSNLDRRQIEAEQAIGTIQDFAQHTRLEEKMQFEMEAYVRSKKGRGSAGVESEQMNKLLNGTFLPKESISQLAVEVFGGELLKNRLMWEVKKGAWTFEVSVPDRLVVFLASIVMESEYLQYETVFKYNEMATAFHIVLEGTFGYYHGDEDDGENAGPYKLMGYRSYFGTYEVLHDIENRIAPARCESKKGLALSVPKKDFINICLENCPGFWNALRKMSGVHEFARRRRLRDWPVSIPYKLLAALTILHNYRTWKEGKKGAPLSRPASRAAREIASRVKGRPDDHQSILRELSQLRKITQDSNDKMMKIQSDLQFFLQSDDSKLTE
eukprot:TRINITY_DN19669_c0_g1_i1.p1 TRINITY_DN19669_c0_g1~~TRINITY_DN19669_c0_g1_i1.p1  ORF type:complete len:697 (+),score=118.68 TRINITY_DN19669_c0_g1_i1:44-2134(+)